MTDEIKADIQSLAPSALIELFEIDLTPLGDSIYRFHMGTNELESNIVWQGETYKAWAGQSSGFDMSTSGQSPRPTIVLGNTLGTITALVVLLNDCVGGKVTRKRTLAKYLDAVNFTGGVNADADPAAELPDDIFFINRKVSETNEAVEFELSAPYDVVDTKLPRRQIVQNLCPWRYRGAECGYTGVPIADRNDNYLTLAAAQSAEEIDFINALNALLAAKADLPIKAAIVSEKSLLLTQARVLQLTSSQYSRTAPLYYYSESVLGSNTVSTAYWNGSTVTIGDTYRIGAKKEGPVRVGQSEVTYYGIEKWEVDASAESAAQSAYDSALTNYNTAISTHATALSTYETASAAVPSDSNLLNFDSCGKRLASCKLRFGEDEELPFGGFPGAGILS